MLRPKSAQRNPKHSRSRLGPSVLVGIWSELAEFGRKHRHSQESCITFDLLDDTAGCWACLIHRVLAETPRAPDGAAGISEAGGIAVITEAHLPQSITSCGWTIFSFFTYENVGTKFGWQLAAINCSHALTASKGKITMPSSLLNYCTFSKTLFNKMAK